MLGDLITNLSGVLIFLFIFWNRLKEDFIANQIFGSAFIFIAALLSGRVLSNIIATSYWFWLMLVSLIFGFILAVVRFRMKLLETAEAVVISLLPWLSFYFLADSITNTNLSSLIGSLVLLVLIVLFFLVDRHYKKFSWYKSGRVGFSGFSIMGLFFLIRASVALFAEGVLSFSSNYEVYFSGIFAFLSFLVVFNQARAKS